ncbi:hypothetical protein HG537_0F03630 [Torulaspora globosa]|uniref:Uncharacterized protein n=1 Tax=Torulaspora globosa TaxID=48254 RepID=A0A7H9HYR6_9SACH|nr:hypothetical protein HG537_0F03630 [Torulaspora sp. CBS 2947]
MTEDTPDLTEFTAADLSLALKKLQEGEQTADEIERKLDLMEQRMALLLQQVEQMQNNTQKIQTTQTKNDN